MVNRLRLICMVTLFLPLAAPVVALAQALPPFVTVATFQVKPDMRLEFEALQEEANAARQEAGITARFAYRVARGGSVNEYVFLTPTEALANYDQPLPVRRGMSESGAAQWFARLNKCIDDLRLNTLRVRADLSIPLAEGRTATLWRLRTVEVRPGRGQDYQGWITDNWVPAMKNAGMNGVVHFQDAFGVGQRTWTRLTAYDSWAELDGHPVARHLGPEAFSEMLGNQGEMTHGPEVRILELLPNLSIFASNP